MHRLIGAFLLFLPLVFCDDQLAPCQEKQVCVAFVFDKCGQMTEKGYTGLIWETAKPCEGSTYHELYARIDFEFPSDETWSVVVTTSRYIHTVRFTFEHAELSFFNEVTAKFTWNYAEKKGKTQCPISQLKPITRSGLGRHNFNRYKFSISAEGERLIDLIGGPNITYTSSKETIPLSDERFAVLLAQHTHSSVWLWLGIVFGILLLLTVIVILVYCFYWKRKRNDQTESKSAKDQKTGLTAKFLALLKKKGETASSTEKGKTPGKSSKKKKKGKSDRPDSITDIEGLHTESVGTKDKLTNVRVASVDIPAKPASPAGGNKKRRTLPPPSPLQEPKGNDKYAGPPLPPGFASVALA